MEKRTNLIFRNIFLPEWDAEMESFFNDALAELQRYSEARHYPEWAHPKPRVSGFDEALEVDFLIPGIESESINVEPIENVVILSGLRWCTPPGEPGEKLVFFRRVIHLTALVSQENWNVSSDERGRVKLILQKTPDPSEGPAPNGQTRPSGHGKKMSEAPRNPVSGTVNGKLRWGTPGGNGITISRINRDLASGMNCIQIARKYRIPTATVRELKQRLGLPKQ